MYKKERSKYQIALVGGRLNLSNYNLHLASCTMMPIIIAKTTAPMIMKIIFFFRALF